MTFTDQDGNIIGRRGIRQDDAIPLEEIPPHVINAVLATEDARFYQHFGVDVIGTFRAHHRKCQGQRRRAGRLSITQQLAKNLFLSPEKTMQRKIHEAFLALWIEARLTKDEILKMYLDRSYLGGGNYGVEAAAQYYFGKSVRDCEPVGSGDAGRPVQGAVQICARMPMSIDARDARQCRALPNARCRLHHPRRTAGGAARCRRRSSARVSTTVPTGSSTRHMPNTGADRKQGLTGDYVIEVKTTIERRLQQAAQRIVNDAIDTEAPGLSRDPGRIGDHGRPTARSRRSSAAGTTRSASSTAPPMRCASPARRSSRSSI